MSHIPRLAFLPLAMVGLSGSHPAFMPPATPYERPQPSHYARAALEPDVRGGELRILDDSGGGHAFPLEHTDVRAEIAGNVARVEVTQIFRNPYRRTIEAVYVFPLPHRAAVDDMEFRVGERKIRGIIKRREEARRIYETARKRGHLAALLDQERPNIFTQSVANILPGNSVQVRIRYFETLPYLGGDYTFSFPMVVGPRFIPGQPVSSGERGWAHATTDVPDASRITPPVLGPGERSGHDISLTVELDAGADLLRVDSPSHQVLMERQDPSRAHVELAPGDTIPNRDFVLRYQLDGDNPRLALLSHRRDEDGYFLMMIQPEAAPSPDEIASKELIFVVDGSGSMSGFPIEKAKEAMRYALQNLDPRDTFQIIRFSNRAEAFAPEPLPATRENVGRGLEFVATLNGKGGTIMLEGVREALRYPEDPERLRIISFMTDGYIGNENQILAYLERHLGGARLFSFGVGSSVNRYLLDKMAQFGRGAVEYVLLDDDAREPINRFYERIRSPYLTDIEIDWGGLAVEDVYPSRIPDLFVGQPVAVHGRYRQEGKGTVTLQARMGGKSYRQHLEVHLPARRDEGEALGSLWARAHIEALSDRQLVDPRSQIVEEITKLALDHRLVSAYTSFVAVEDRLVTGSDGPVLVEVPVEMPAGVSYQGVFGAHQEVLPAAPPPGRQLSLVAPEPGGFAGTDRMERSSRPTAPGEFPRAAFEESKKRAGVKTSGIACRLESSRPAYRLGEPIEIRVIIENTTTQPVDIPASLSVELGTARFQIVDQQWNILTPPMATTARGTKRVLAPGETVRFRVLLNGARGYRFERPGIYHIVLRGSTLGVEDSAPLTLRIDR